jgi:hypothetical protein
LRSFNLENLMTPPSKIWNQEFWEHFDVLAATPRASKRGGGAQLRSGTGVRRPESKRRAGSLVSAHPARPGRESLPRPCYGAIDMVAEKEGALRTISRSYHKNSARRRLAEADGTALGSDNGVVWLRRSL